MILQNRKPKTMNFKQTITLVVFSISLTLGCSINITAQTGTGFATSQLAISENKQPAASLLNSTSADAESSKIKPSVTVRDPKTVRDTNDPKTDTTAKSDPIPPRASADQWHFQFTPYLWVVGVSGQGGIGTVTVNSDSGPTGANVHLNFGFMGTFEARRNKLAVVTDLQYSNLGTKNPTPGPLFSTASADFKTFVLDPEVGYRIAANPEKGRFIDVLGGVRYWHLRADLNLNAGLFSARSASGSRAWADGVVGIRGRASVSKKLFVLGKADIGGGGSKFTYQLFGGAGIGVGKRTSLIGGYRHLHVNYDKDNFLFDTSLSGPIFGVSFRLGE
jgi:hypothetical protein